MWIIALMLLLAIVKYICLPVAVIVLAYLAIKKISEKKNPTKKVEDQGNPPA